MSTTSSAFVGASFVGSSQVSRALAAEIVRASRDNSVTPRELQLLSRMARAEGAESTARALSDRAGGPKGTSGRETKIPDPATITSPILGVQGEAYARLARALAANRSPNSADQGRVGGYAMSVRRLADLGIVKNPRKVRGSWEADWESPSREEFEAQPDLQAAALGRSMSGYADEVREKYGKAIGKDVGGRPVTLSGLLGVAHVAGLQGLESWLRDGEVRKKFPGTTKLFEATNGVF